MVSLGRTEQHIEAKVKVQQQNKIVAKSIYFNYEDLEILRDINLEVKEGEFIVFMGPSGSGKSTFLRILTGLVFPKAGEVSVNDRPTTAGFPESGVVFQDYSLFPWLTAEENIVLAIHNKFKGEKTKKEIEHLAQSYLELVGLGHAIRKYPGEMSGGMRQRAAIARALAIGSDLMFMDEPFGALDPVTRINLQDLIIEVNQNQNRTVVFVTHDAEEAIFLADRIVMFTPGPPGRIATIMDVPFPKPRNRKKLLESKAFVHFRDRVLDVMNREVLNKLEESHNVQVGGDKI